MHRVIGVELRCGISACIREQPFCKSPVQRRNPIDLFHDGMIQAVVLHLKVWVLRLCLHLLCRFFIFWGILLLTHFMAVTLFRMIGHVTRSIVVANACGSLALLAMMMLGGFVLTKSQIHPW